MSTTPTPIRPAQAKPLSPEKRPFAEYIPQPVPPYAPPCSETGGPELFGQAIDDPTDQTVVKACKERCLACPILMACGKWAVANEVEGVWGAMTSAERKRVRRALNIRPRMYSTRVDPRNREARPPVRLATQEKIA